MPSTFGFTFNAITAEIQNGVPGFSQQTKVSLPYPVNQSLNNPLDGFVINWNGITSTATPKETPSPESTTDPLAEASKLATRLNAAPEALRRIDIVPPSRGFFQPYYSPVPTTPFLTTELEVATLIMNPSDQYLKFRISSYLEKILDRRFDTFMPPGTATVYFQTLEKESNTPVNLVNDAFGVNQVIYLLAKILRQESRTIIIEEPEVHLHPRVIQKFAKACIDFAKLEKKQLIFTTHSSAFLTAFAASVAIGQLETSDVCLIEASRDRRNTILTSRSISEDGQIEGGLGVFDDPSLEDLEAVLQARKKANG
jgi:hypothetical protein